MASTAEELEDLVDALSHSALAAELRQRGNTDAALSAGRMGSSPLYRSRGERALLKLLQQPGAPPLGTFSAAAAGQPAGDDEEERAPRKIVAVWHAAAAAATGGSGATAAEDEERVLRLPEDVKESDALPLPPGKRRPAAQHMHAHARTRVHTLH